MKETLISILLTSMLLILFLTYMPTAQAQSVEDKRETIESFVNRITQNQDFQGNIVVEIDDQIIFSRSIGYSNIEDGFLNTLDTTFRIGSLTKSFSAVTAMQFVEDGLLDLHSPIGLYLPYLDPHIGQKITTHQLLKMQSGLPAHLARITTLEYRDISRRELIEIINTATLAFEPGSAYSYSNINYTLIALILEEISGLSFPEILNKRTFGPLRMTHSGVERTNDQIPSMALGYDNSTTGTITPADRNYMAYAIGSGDIYANIRDLLKWDQVLLDDDYLSNSSRKLLFTKDQPDSLGHYGYGFRVHHYVRDSLDQKKGTLIRHGGSMQGYLSNYHKYLDDKLTIVILGNIRPYDVMDITTGIKEIIFGREAIPRSEMPYRY